MPDDETIIRFPITHSQRRQNSPGPLKVECIVSGRVLSFEGIATPLKEGSAVSVDVLAMSEDDKEPRKLCSLILTKEDLQRALDAIKTKEATDR